MPRRRYSRGYARSRRRSSKGGSLTGGTGDVNPQWFNLTSWTPSSATTPAAGDALSIESVVPLQQQALMASKGARSMVMELLTVEFSKPATTVVGSIAVTTKKFSGTVAESDLACNNGHVIAGKNFTAFINSFNPPDPDGEAHQIADLTDQVRRSLPPSTVSFVPALTALISLDTVSSSVARRSTSL